MEVSLVMKVKQGRNQKGLCFVSDDSSFDDGVYQLSFNDRTLLADVRSSSSVPNNMLILDNRIFKWLSCGEDDEIELIQIAIDDISQNEKQAYKKLRDHSKIRKEIEELEKAEKAGKILSNFI